MHFFPVYKRLLMAGIFFSAALYAQGQVPSNKPTATAQPTATAVPVPAAYPTGTKINYIRTREAMARYPNYTADQFNVITDYKEVKEATQYIDGLGRPLQTVSRQSTPGATPKDMVAPVVYDAFGREVYKYLPYVSAGADGKFKMNAFTEQAGFMQAAYPGENIYYGKTIYEASPLNRVEKSFAPGNSWAGSEGSPTAEHAVKMQYLVNTSGDDIKNWTILNDALTYLSEDITTNIPSTISTYPAGELYKNISIDEQGNAVVEYKDKEGLVLLKKVQAGTIASDYSGYIGFLTTCYIYDDLNRLRFVIPPKAVEAIRPGWELNATVINELCFRYEYDGRNRMIAKKVPGAGWVYMVYDKRDRLVFTQDANQRTAPARWMVTLYDQLNRPVTTGMMSGYTGNREALQTYVNGATGAGANTTVTISGKSYSANAATITLNNLQAGVLNHKAANTIIWDNGFVSDNTTDLIDEIYPSSVSSASENQTINDNPLPAGTTFIALTISYYDNYSWTNKSYTTQYNSFLNDGATLNLHAETMPSVAEQQQVLTAGLLTGTKVRTLEDPNDLSKGIWLSTVPFYDNRGRVIQSVADNYRGGTDIITNRYDFAGKVLSSYLVHNNPAVDPANATATVRVRTSMKYDHAGRLLESWKTMNDDDSKKALIVQNDYDELGQLKNKKLAKQKTSTGTYLPAEVGNFDYSYNIRGWLKGINKDFANDPSPVGGAGGGRWFGMELNYDWGFASNQFNGNIGGIKWRSRGDGDRRAYGFGYDKVNRLLSGDFSQHNNTSYVDNGAVNFDMMMGDGTTAASAYDENGNIKAMKQWGVKLNSSELIDNLSYNYLYNGSSATNKLINVIDAENKPDTKLGDFRTSTLHPVQNKNAATVDYTYDNNGNLKKDLNKDIGNGTTDGIEYNHLNLPWKITVKSATGDKGTITYVYDATGNKISKTTIEGTQKTVTYYAGGMVYEVKSHSSTTASDVLQFMAHEEGRTRYIPAVGVTPARFEHDYFVKDHLGNIRLVLTEEYRQDIYPAATLEGSMNTPSDAMYIEKGYYNIDQNFIVHKAAATGIGDYYNHNGNPPVNNNPNSNTGVYSTKLYQQNAQTNKIGLGMTLKVMAGDQLNIWGRSYWFTAAGNFTDKNTIGVSSLLDAFANTPAIAAKGITAGTINTTQVFDGITDFFKHNNDADDTKPWAYINWVFFDERFNYAGGGFDRIGASGTVKDHNNSTIPNIIVPKNGYVFVYCSNESNYNVFFDNLQVVHTRGALLEETHYYPFGLTMAGISSKAMNFGGLENKRKFNQGTELNTDFNINLYETNYRSLDPQLGRFWQIDPLAEMHPNLTSYSFVGNNPLRYNDPYGLDTIPTTVNNGKMNVPKNPNQGDVLKIDNGDGTFSFYNYDPNNPAANSQGYVGAGIDGGTEQAVTVTAKKKSSGVNLQFWLDPTIAGGEYQLGKVLDKYGSDGYGRGRPFWPGPAQRVFDRNFPKGSYPNVRPVNIHIPATGSSVQVPRYIVSSTGQLLKFVGVGMAAIGTVSTEVQYANGEISNAHRWTNHTMTVVAFLPGGLVVSLIYSGVVEDMIFKGKAPNFMPEEYWAESLYIPGF